MENKLDFLKTRLELQRDRILLGPHQLHDSDFYVIILGRIYRYLDKLSKSNPRVANLKGKYRELLSNIKIRQYFEHEDGIDIKKFPATDASDIPGIKSTVASVIANIKIINSTFINKEKAIIVSGNLKWDLDSDHNLLLELLGEITFPFGQGRGESEAR